MKQWFSNIGQWTAQETVILSRRKTKEWLLKLPWFTAWRAFPGCNEGGEPMQTQVVSLIEETGLEGQGDQGSRSLQGRVLQRRGSLHMDGTPESRDFTPSHPHQVQVHGSIFTSACVWGSYLETSEIPTQREQKEPCLEVTQSGEQFIFSPVRVENFINYGHQVEYRRVWLRSGTRSTLGKNPALVHSNKAYRNPWKYQSFSKWFVPSQNKVLKNYISSLYKSRGKHNHVKERHKIWKDRKNTNKSSRDEKYNIWNF